MSHVKSLIGLKLILKNSDERILTLEARNIGDRGDMNGYYDLPGGKIDNEEVGKDFSAIISREVHEELGNIKYSLNSRPITALSWMWPDNTPVVLIYFEAKLLSGEITISDEHLSYKWISPNKEEVQKYFTSYHLFAMTKYLELSN